MDYLNHGKCTGACDHNNGFKIGNLSIKSPADVTYPHSEPALDQFEWEEAPWDTKMCPDYGADECKYSWRCISCRMSYPVGDPDKFNSKDAKCRCYDWTPFPYGLERNTYCPAF